MSELGGEPLEQEWRRTDPLGLVVHLLVSFGRGLLPLAAVVLGARGEWGQTVLGGVGALVLVVAAGIGWLNWRHQRYRIGAEDIRVEKGILGRQARSVPYERIQDVAIEEALIPRLLGLVEVRFETGAGGKDEVTLAYVDRAQGEALRATIRRRQGEAGSRAGEAHEVAVEPPARLLFAMNARRLLTFGLFEFSLVIFAILFGAAQQFETLIPFDLWEAEEWQATAEGPARLLLGLGIAAQAVVAVLGMLVLLFVGLLTGVVRTILRDWGFRLEDTPRGLRRRRGLLTRTDVVMPLHRVQALTVTTGIVRRRFGPDGGWHALHLISLAQDAKSASHVAVPFGTLAEIAPVAALTDFALPGGATQWRRPSARHRLDQALLAAVPLGLAAVGFAAAGAEWQGLALGMLGALLAVRQAFLWRYDRHALDSEHLCVRRGWLSPRLDVGSRAKLQSVSIEQGPLAQRRGYADLVFGVAGGHLRIRGIALTEARALRGQVVRSIAAVDFSRLARVQSETRGGPGLAGAPQDDASSAMLHQ